MGAMEYFWKQQDDIPAGMGYPLFGITHLFCVGMTAVVVLLIVAVFKHLDDITQKRFLKVIPIFMVFLEVFKIFFCYRLTDSVLDTFRFMYAVWEYSYFFCGSICHGNGQKRYLER